MPQPHFTPDGKTIPANIDADIAAERLREATEHNRNTITLDWSNGIPTDGPEQLIAALDKRCAVDEPTEIEFTVNGLVFTVSQVPYGPHVDKWIWSNWSKGFNPVVITEGDYFTTAAEAQADSIRYARGFDTLCPRSRGGLIAVSQATNQRRIP